MVTVKNKTSSTDKMEAILIDTWAEISHLPLKLKNNVPRGKKYNHQKYFS